jgi:hypothetical protein
MIPLRILLTALVVSIGAPGCNALKTVVEDAERELHAEDDVDDRFPQDGDGVITDTVTGLRWRVGPDRDTDWMTAHTWVENLDGDWRMPTPSEIRVLHEAGVKWNYMGPFYSNGQSVWSDSTSHYGSHAWLYDFFVESGAWVDVSTSNLVRGFAVSQRAPE